MIVAGLDIASAFAFAVGPIGAKPKDVTVRSLRHAKTNSSQDERLSAALIEARSFAIEFRPDLVGIERVMSHNRTFRGRVTSRESVELLNGLVGVWRAVLTSEGIPIELVEADECRRSFLGANPPREDAKAAVTRIARLSGYEIKNDDGGDAVAVRHYVEVRARLEARIVKT